MDITGPHDSAADDEEWWAMVAGLTKATQRLDRMVEYSCRILARTQPIHAIIRGASDNEPFAADFGRRLLAERLANQTERIQRFIAEDVRPGLSIAEAGRGIAPSPVPSSTTCSPLRSVGRPRNIGHG
jgi:hypothetical protein